MLCYAFPQKQGEAGWGSERKQEYPHETHIYRLVVTTVTESDPFSGEDFGHEMGICGGACKSRHQSKMLLLLVKHSIRINSSLQCNVT